MGGLHEEGCKKAVDDDRWREKAADREKWKRITAGGSAAVQELASPHPYTGSKIECQQSCFSGQLMINVQ